MTFFSEAVEEKQLLKLCRETVKPREILSACFYGPRSYGQADEKTEVKTLLVVPSYSPMISYFDKQIGDVEVSILAIDQKVFESDVDHGRYGEFVAEILVLPYQPWINPSYIIEMEVKMKKRFVSDLLRNIVLEHPELSLELLIKPEYFMYEVIRRRAKLFPPLMHSFSNVFKKEVKKRNVDAIMKGYLKALKMLEMEQHVKEEDGYIRITKGFIETTKRKKGMFSDIFMSIRKVLLPYIRGFSTKATTAFHQDQKLSGSTHETITEDLRELEETERHLMMPTPLGPVPFSDKTNIRQFVRKTVPGGETLKIKIERMGGVLNSVFLLRLRKNHETQKIVVKKFEDWRGFKWFPLALWTLGTQSFAVLGKTRLEREYSINQFLSKRGFTVPHILYISVKERLIFEDYVEGKKMSETIKETIGRRSKVQKSKSSETIKAAGMEVARAHSLGVTLGDCKPENILVTDNREICFLDLEQATINGNHAWDIAEFLYYSGHYLPVHSDESARIIASSFVDGYLAAGGDRQAVRKAASARYTKVFSIFTLPNVILTMANVCKEMGKDVTATKKKNGGFSAFSPSA